MAGYIFVDGSQIPNLDWNETDETSSAYIANKPDFTLYKCQDLGLIPESVEMTPTDVVINPTLGNMVKLTCNGNINIILQYPENCNDSITVYLQIVNGGNYNVYFDDHIRFENDTLPTLTVDGTDTFTFITSDKGENWYCSYILNE